MTEWLARDYSGWPEFFDSHDGKLELDEGTRPLPRAGTRLASTVQTVLEVARRHIESLDDVSNVLLYVHDGRTADQLPHRASADFRLVCVDYSQHRTGNFIAIDL